MILQHERMPPLVRLIFLIACIPLYAAAQDARQVHEPSMPPVCASLQARLNTPDVADEDDTTRLQQAIDHCEAGQAVELTASDRHAFLARPLILRAGIGLIIDDGVTLYASTDPAAYDKATHTCGSNDDSGKGCSPFLTVQGGDKYPLYRDIHLQDVHSITPGRIILNGLDDAHHLQTEFDSVVVAGKADRQVSYADIRVLPDAAPPISCEGRFAPFPTPISP